MRIGLFSHGRYLPNETIATFVCEEISAAEGLQRTEAGGGRYLIKVSTEKVLDCKPAFDRGGCIASYANSPFRCFNIATGRPAKKNAKLRVERLGSGTWRAPLVAICTIEGDNEILFHYETEYVY
jgi:hypothetical protein